MDKSIIQLIKMLKNKKRNDLAELLVGSRSVIEQTDQYGSYWNKFLSSFVIFARREKYKKLQKISDKDRELILQCILEIFPISPEQEIGFLDFRLLPNENKIKENESLANSWLKRAKNKLNEGENLFINHKYSEAISSFQESTEFSLKVILLLLLDKYPKEHKFDDKEFKEVLYRIPEALENLEFHKLYLYSKFWSYFYLTSKYGMENFGIGAERLFEKEEAQLAKKHANKCYFASLQLKNYIQNPW